MWLYRKILLKKQLTFRYMDKDTTEDCYLEYDEDGYLTCSFNHKPGDKCLMNLDTED